MFSWHVLRLHSRGILAPWQVLPHNSPDSRVASAAAATPWGATMNNTIAAAVAGNSPRRVLFASMIGTTIEFFDFYIYATAAVLVFPKLFFPAGDPAAAVLQSLATFAIAFLARPIGSALFGHFGPRTGARKSAG